MLAAANTDRRAEVPVSSHESALEFLALIWGHAEEAGILPETMAEAGISAALATLVQRVGEKATAEIIAELPDRIRAGEFSFVSSRQ